MATRALARAVEQDGVAMREQAIKLLHERNRELELSVREEMLSFRVLAPYRYRVRGTEEKLAEIEKKLSVVTNELAQNYDRLMELQNQ